ncbi:hypothetical protein C8J57DRAFT_1535024 [Mycena rebaudengoi]|nr:hypothetical protein C8J57DRAFT_1535024 [Mycena rebaudengoi]
MARTRSSASTRKSNGTSVPKNTASTATTPKAKTKSKAAAKPTTTSAPSSDLPSGSTLLENSRQTTDQWYKSSRTKKGYAGYVKGGKTWVAEWTAEDRLGDEFSATAFDSIAEETPLALRAFTAYKCEHMQKGFATAEGIRSAYKDYFERVLGCQGDFWKYDPHTKKWEGNPVFESGFKTYYESLKNRDSRTGTTKQALPMLPADLKLIMEYLDGDEAIKHFSVTRRLYFKAFVTTAFTLWTRNDELINLQFKDVKFDLHSEKTGIPYHEFSLIFRKTNKDRTKVQHFQIPRDVNHPEIDCYTHISTWKAHLVSILKRPLTGDDFVFPAIASTGQLKFGEATSRTGFETLLDEIVEKSNIMLGRNGKFTTHCFRRGGAQYRFMWADRKWSLKAVGTIMRYLLDELMAYEEGFSDIMMDDRPLHRHESFMGDDKTAAATKADLREFECNMLLKMQAFFVTIVPTLSNPTIVACAIPDKMIESSSTTTSAPGGSTFHAEVQSQGPLTGPSRIPETNSLADALYYWQHGAPEKGLVIPLNHWSALFNSSQYSTEAVKLGNIRFVCEEFLIQCEGNEQLFEERYPGLKNKFTKLMKAVRVARKARGEAKTRQSRK